jgi:hypothetical protein
MALFMGRYARNLERAVLAHPDEYYYPVADVPVVVERMRAALVAGTFNKDGYAFQWTCRDLRIKHTYKAILAYIEGN